MAYPDTTYKKKTGTPDPLGNGQPAVATTGPSKMVQEMAARNFALRNGGQMPPSMQGSPDGSVPAVATVNPNIDFFGNGNRVTGKYEALPRQNGNAPTVDFTNMQKPQQFTPQGAGNANPAMGPVSAPYMKDAAEATPQNATSFEQIAAGQQPTGWNPDGTARYDSLSAALNGTGAQTQQAAPEFHSDPSKRDGGFFGWLGGLIPKKRPGMREGETPDEYDARRTRNMEMVTTFADAIRHMGNIVNTAKGAPLQQFNDPTTMLEQGYQNRKAERAKKTAADADAAYKAANLSIKDRAAQANEAYKQMLLGYKDAADKRAAQAAADNKKYKDDYFTWQKEQAEKNRERQAAQDKQKQENWQKSFDENKRHHAVSEKNSRKGGGSGRNGGSGGKYWFEDKDGKMHYQPNKTMWEQEFYREYGYLPQGETSTSTSKKTIDYKTGQETTTTTRSKGNSMTAQAAKSQNDAKAARNKPKTGGKSGGKSGGSGKGHSALNDWFKKNNK